MELFGTVGPEIIFEYLVEEYYVRNACLDQVADAGVNQKIKDYLNVQPGMLIPDTEFYSDHDLEIPVRELMSLNELTIIFYWSSYCHFCEGTLPELEALYQSYKDRGLHVVTVALDTGADEWREASGKLNGTWDHICDFKGWESANARTFMVNKTPTMFLVNKEGMLLGKSTNISAIRALVDAIL